MYGTGIILLVSLCVVVAVKRSGKIGAEGFTIVGNFPSGLYLPTWPNPDPKNRARTSDIETVLENDLQVIPLAVDHDQRNGFQYQPIISHQYSTGSMESPRYLQSAVPNLYTQSENGRGPGWPISNRNELKPITKSQLSRETSAAHGSTPKENSEGPFQRARYSPPRCLQRFESQEIRATSEDQTTAGGNLAGWKILTANDQGDNTKHQERRISLQLTPSGDTISGISTYGIDRVYPGCSWTKLVAVDVVPSLSKDEIFVDPPAPANGDRDIKPIFQSNEYPTNYNDYNNPDGYNEGNYQLGTRNTAASTAGYFNGLFERVLPSKIRDAVRELTCNDAAILRAFLPRPYYQGYNYGYNTQEHLPTNPILSLILSHYGIHIPSSRQQRRYYSYMAVNNIHNNKPFGSYKLTTDDDHGLQSE